MLGSASTAAGSLFFQVGNSIDNNNGAVFEPLAWITIFTIAVAAGKFTLSGSNLLQFPDQLIATAMPPSYYTYIASAGGCRLLYAPSSGGGANDLNVAYLGKSFG
jgi:hypothetical protein